MLISVYQGAGGGAVRKKKKNVVDHFRLTRAESRNMLKTSIFTQCFLTQLPTSPV